MSELRSEGCAKGCVGEEGGRVGAGRGDSRYVAEALRGTWSSSGHSGWRAKSQGEGNGDEAEEEGGEQILGNDVDVFQAGTELTQSYLLFERILLVSDHRTGFQE